jgi:NitT/TauT family transport system substrate-binding protein
MGTSEGVSFAWYGTAGGSGILAQNSVPVMLQRLSMRALALLLLAAMVSFAAPGPAGAQTALTDVSFGILTPTAAEWPLYITQAEGYFKDEGLNVSIVQGNSPPNVINMVATNGVNLADNGCDSEFVAIAHGLGIKIVAPMFTTNPYSLVVLPSIKTWADLKGKSVMLATKQDVTAIAFIAMAAAHNLKLDDFSIVLSGNSTERIAGLNSGNVQGAMLNEPYDLAAEASGDRILGSAVDTTKDWAFACIFANTSWAEKNRPLVVKFLRAVHRGMQYGYAHKAESVAALVASAHIDPAIAARSWDIDFGKWKAYDPNLKLSSSGIAAIGKYQVGFGIIPVVPPMADLYDPSFAAEALKNPK